MLNFRSLFFLFLLVLVVLVQPMMRPLDPACVALDSHAPVGSCDAVPGESASQHFMHSMHVDPVGSPQLTTGVPVLFPSYTLPRSTMLLTYSQVIAPPDQPPRAS